MRWRGQWWILDRPCCDVGAPRSVSRRDWPAIANAYRGYDCRMQSRIRRGQFFTLDWTRKNICSICLPLRMENQSIGLTKSPTLPSTPMTVRIICFAPRARMHNCQILVASGYWPDHINRLKHKITGVFMPHIISFRVDAGRLLGHVYHLANGNFLMVFPCQHLPSADCYSIEPDAKPHRVKLRFSL